jgi:hypothetical protein
MPENEKKVVNPSETIPGGRYILNGQYVDANNVPLADQGDLTPKKEKAEEKADKKDK